MCALDPWRARWTSNQQRVLIVNLVEIHPGPRRRFIAATPAPATADLISEPTTRRRCSRQPSSTTRRRCPRRPSPTSFTDVRRRRLIVTARQPSPTSFADVSHHRLVVTARRPSPASFADAPRRCLIVITWRPSPTSLVAAELQASCLRRRPDNAIRH